MSAFGFVDQRTRDQAPMRFPGRHLQSSHRRMNTTNPLLLKITVMSSSVHGNGRFIEGWPRIAGLGFQL